MEKEEYIELFYQYRRKICNFLFYKCGDMGLSEDLVQEAFLILWEKRNSIDSKNLKSYLYKVSNNLFLDKYRRSSSYLNLDLKYNIESISESPEYLMEIKEFDQRLRNAIASLSEKERIVFLMNRIDGLKFKEIAEYLDLSIKAVEKRMHSALEKLHRKINYKL